MTIKTIIEELNKEIEHFNEIVNDPNNGISQNDEVDYDRKNRTLYYINKCDGQKYCVTITAI